MLDLSPTVVARLESVAHLVATRGDAVALISDFDGTLAPIVDDPAEARPHPGALAAFEALASIVGTAALVSGRPLSYLERLVAEPVDLYGLYGLEWRVDGRPGVVDAAERWAPVIAEMAVAARAGLPSEVTVESKGLSLTLHHRRAPTAAPAVEAWAAEATARWGVEARSAKASVELHPAIGVDKGTVVAAVGAGHEAVIFFGDDVGDLSAFAALAGLGRAGALVLGIGVDSAEAPAELASAVDAMVPGVEGVAAVLRMLTPGSPA